jgi:hypothetical protein
MAAVPRLEAVWTSRLCLVMLGITAIIPTILTGDQKSREPPAPVDTTASGYYYRGTAAKPAGRPFA